MGRRTVGRLNSLRLKNVFPKLFNVSLKIAKEMSKFVTTKFATYP